MKNYFLLIMLLIASNCFASVHIVRSPTHTMYDPCVLYNVYDANATPEVGEYFSSMEVSFSVTQGNPTGNVWIVDNMTTDVQLSAAHSHGLEKCGSYLFDIDTENTNYFKTYSLPPNAGDIRNDPNIIWEDYTTKETVNLPPLGDITKTNFFFRSNMLAVNDFWGTGNAGFGLCFLNVVGIKDLEVILHLNTGKTHKFEQTETGLMLVNGVIVYYKTDVCHLKTCRYYKDTMTAVTLTEMIELNKRLCKVCGKHIVLP